MPDTDPGPSAEAAVKLPMPAGPLAEVRNLVFSTAGNPDYSAGFNKGTPKGSAVALRTEVWVAWVHANLALNSTTLPAIQQHAGHVVNAINGGAGQDLNNDGAAQTFGDKGPGIFAYAGQVRTQATAASAAAPEDTRLAKNSGLTIQAAGGTMLWVGQARAQAMSALAATDIILARGAVANAKDRLGRAFAASNGVHRAAQDMGMYVFAPSAPVPADGEVKLPPTGDSILPGLALLGLILGLVLLAAGGGPPCTASTGGGGPPLSVPPSNRNR